MTASCATCGATWSGTRACHCSGCHRTFSGLTLFDRHRSIAGTHGACSDPAEWGDDVELRDGVWRAPEMTAEAKARAFGNRSGGMTT